MRIIIVLICLLLTIPCFAEGQAGLEVVFFGIYFLTFLFYTTIGGFILLKIINLLNYKTNRNTILLAFSLALCISYLFYLLYPNNFIFLGWFLLL